MEISENSSSKKKGKELNRIQKVFIFCSGANPKILQECPTEVGKYLAVGATVLLTSILAAISGGYAINMVFGNTIISVIVGLFWGVVIFNLDRYIVMSIRKKKAPSAFDIIRASSPEEKSKLRWEKFCLSGNQFMMAMPRILIAIVIAITVSKPIELRLFDGRIQKQLGETQRGDVTACEEEFNEKLAYSQAEITKIDNQEEKDKDKVFTGNPIYTDLKKSIKDQEQKVQPLKTHIKNNESTIAKNYFFVDVPFYVDSLLANSMVIRIKKTRKERRPNQTALRLLKENRELGNDLSTLLSTVANNKEEKDKVEATFGGQIAGIKQKFDIQRQPHLGEIKRLNDGKAPFIQDCRGKSMASVDLLARLEAMETISQKSEVIYHASLLITILFILLETSPVLVKLLTPRGPYEETLDRIEHEHFVNENEKISSINSRINELLERSEQAAKMEGDLFIKSQDQRLTQEMESNEKILAYIAEKQEKLAIMEIDKWYADELAKHSQNTNGATGPELTYLANYHHATTI